MAGGRERSPQFSFGSDPEPPSRRGGAGRGRALLVLAVVLALLALGIGYAYLYHPEQIRALLGDSPLAPPPSVTRAYKWQDEHGSWHVSDQPPPDGTPYQTITVRSDTNVMPLVPEHLRER